MKDKRQFIVWGLGRFGSSVAETLTSLGHEVLGIDNNEDVVENMADKLTHAVVCDVIDEKTVNSWASGTSMWEWWPSATWNPVCCHPAAEGSG